MRNECGEQEQEHNFEWTIAWRWNHNAHSKKKKKNACVFIISVLMSAHFSNGILFN